MDRNANRIANAADQPQPTTTTNGDQITSHSNIAHGSQLKPANPNDHGPTLVADLDGLLTVLGLTSLEEFENYCEDEMELLAVVGYDADGRLEIFSIGSCIGTGIEFPLSVEFFEEILIDIEEMTMGFA